MESFSSRALVCNFNSLNVIENFLFHHLLIFMSKISVVANSLFEGDIKLSPLDLRFVDTREEGDVDGELAPSRQKRNANRNRMVLWQDKVVPYKFDSSLSGKRKSAACLKV